LCRISTSPNRGPLGNLNHIFIVPFSSAYMKDTRRVVLSHHLPEKRSSREIRTTARRTSDVGDRARDSRNRQLSAAQLWQGHEHAVTSERDERQRTTDKAETRCRLRCLAFAVSRGGNKRVLQRRNTHSRFGNSQRVLRMLLFGARAKFTVVFVVVVVEEFQLELRILDRRGPGLSSAIQTLPS